MVQDTSIIKNKIVAFLESNGPSIPVHIAKHIDTSMLFTSAFLSELLAEQKIKMSFMKVGSSSIYYLKNNDPELEKYAEYLKSKEKEAFQRLKEKQFLIDKEEHPAIRVALREIKDFAKPFQRKEDLIWRYFTALEAEYPEEIKTSIPASMMSDVRKVLNEKHVDIIEDIKEEIEDTLEEDLESKELSEKLEKIVETPQEKIKEKKPKTERKKTTPKIIKKKSVVKKSTKDEKFFNVVKEYLSKENFEIEDIEGFSKESLILKIKKGKEILLLVAYNKKRLTDEDIVNAHKKAEERNSKYSILSFGDPLKKTNNLINALKDLKELKKIE